MKAVTVFFTVLSLAATIQAGKHSNSGTINCYGPGETCIGSQSGQSTTATKIGRKRSLAELFQRSPATGSHATAPAAQNAPGSHDGAATAQHGSHMTISQYVTALKAGKPLPKEVQDAAKAAGWTPPPSAKHHTASAPAPKVARNAAVTTGTRPKHGIPHAEAAAHVAAGKPLPKEIIDAAIAGGWTPPGGNPKQARHIEARGVYEREAYPEAYFEERDMFEREAYPEIEERDFFERDAEAEAYFGEREFFEREAYPEAYFEERDLYEREAYPEAYSEERSYGY